ncbi:uncharacterized protein [Branchiostoma lanceolatum]|uniref:uncharacterized protein isoform X2 n=1 Tax=Branchiostoma lanceolatum TaxID=7740 RepID=UPI0034528ACF
MDCRYLLLLLAATSLLVSLSSAIPYRTAYRNSAVDDNLLKALLRVQELEEEKAAEEAAEKEAEEEAEKEAVVETLTELLDEEEARREEALAKEEEKEEEAERAEDGRFNLPAYDFEYPEYDDTEEIPSNEINGQLSYPDYEPLPADTRSLELPYNSYPRQQYDEVDRRGDEKYDLDQLYPDLPDTDPEPQISEPEDAISPEEYAALLDYLGLQEDTRRSDGYYDGEEVNMLEDYDPRKTTKRTRDNDAYHRAYNMFWSNLGKPREEERGWEDRRDDTEELDDWNKGGAYGVQDLGAAKKALERPGDQGKVSWRHPGNDVAAGYTGYEPYQREKYPSSVEDMMDTYGPDQAYWPYEDDERYQERSSQPEWTNTARDDQQDDDYESFLTRNERNDKLLDALYEDQIPANVVDAEDTEEDDEEDLDKYEKMAEDLLREYPELATAAEKVLDELIDEEDAEDDERREDGMFGGGEESEEPTFKEEQKIDNRADKNPLEGYTHNNIDILQRKRLFQDEEDEDEDEGEGGGDKDDDKLPVNYYDILKENGELPSDEEENNDAEDPYSLDAVYDTNDEKKVDVVEDYPDGYPDSPPETAEDEPRSPEEEDDLELDEDRVESFLDKVEDLLRATEAVSPPLCPVNVSDCHLIEDDSPLSSGPYKEYFTAVCNRHEACYQCGSAHGISSSTCDRAMKYDLAEVCDMLAEVEGQEADEMCKMKGEALHLAARLKRAYQETTVPECTYKCVMEYIVGS